MGILVWCLPGYNASSEGYLPGIQEERSGIFLDDKEENWKKAFKEEALPWIDGSNLLGWKDPIAKQYAITGIPFKILIGKDGVIVDKGFARSGSLEKAMDEYLNKVK